jgi:hypothetical protein
MDEREQLQQIEPTQIRIAEPLTDQGRIEDDVRCLRRASNRLASAGFASLAFATGNPDAGVGRMERWKSDRRHPTTLGQSGTKMEREISG